MTSLVAISEKYRYEYAHRTNNLPLLLPLVLADLAPRQGFFGDVPTCSNNICVMNEPT